MVITYQRWDTDILVWRLDAVWLVAAITRGKGVLGATLLTRGVVTAADTIVVAMLETGVTLRDTDVRADTILLTGGVMTTLLSASLTISLAVATADRKFSVGLMKTI